MTSTYGVDQHKFECVSFGLLGISFHVLATPAILGVPVRASLADIVLGFVFVIAGYRWLIKKQPLPKWNFSLGQMLWLGAMFVVLLASLFHGGIAGDEAAAWARMKVVGFVVLIGYFVLGGWFGASAEGRTAQCAIKGFILAAWAHALYGLGQYMAYFFLDYKIPWYPRIAGLAQNPNSYGIMLAASLALYWGLSAWGRPLFNRRLEFWGTTVTLLAIYLSASRSAYLGTFLAVIALMLSTNLDDRKILRPAIAAGLLFASVFIAVPAAPGIYYKIYDTVSEMTAQPGAETEQPGAEGEQPNSSIFGFMKKNYAMSRGYVDQGVTSRVKLYEQAVEMWIEQPWFGAGLGTFWRVQQESTDKSAYVNHNTILWLASETGIVGLLVFGGGVLFAGVVLARKARTVGIAGGALGMLLVLVGASAGTEVMYQRYAWFFCGMALVLVLKPSASAHGAAGSVGPGQ